VSASRRAFLAGVTKGQMRATKVYAIHDGVRRQPQIRGENTNERKSMEGFSRSL
jgi:hypothetical protein